MWIYLLTNTVNGKQYIGQTHVDPNVRFSEHRKSSRYISSRRRYIIARAIHKHGWENFKAEVIEKCKSQDELDARERHFIEQYGCIAPYGYNADLGGRGRGRVSDLTKLKIGIANAGKVLSASTREKISASRKGIGRTPKSAQHRAKIGIANSGERCGAAKLTWDIVREIRRSYIEERPPQKELAGKYGVTQGVISLIVRNKTWVEAPPL